MFHLHPHHGPLTPSPSATPPAPLPFPVTRTIPTLSRNPRISRQPSPSGFTLSPHPDPCHQLPLSRCQVLIERGPRDAILKLLTTFFGLSWVFSLFAMQTKGWNFSNAITYGRASYVATGRGYQVETVSVPELYSKYAQSHIYLAFEMVFYLIIFQNVTAILDFSRGCSAAGWVHCPRHCRNLQSSSAVGADELLRTTSRKEFSR